MHFNYIGLTIYSNETNFIDVKKGDFILRIDNKQEIFNIHTPFKELPNYKYCYRIGEEKQLDKRHYTNQREICRIIGALKDEKGNIKS